MTEEQETTESSQPKKTSPKRRLFLWGVLLIVLAAFSVMYFIQNNDFHASPRHKLAHQVTKALGSMNVAKQQHQQSHAIVAASVQQLQQQLQSLQQQVEHLTAHQGIVKSSDARWMLADAAYLTRLAIYQLQFEHNVPVAISLLKTADKQIASLKTPMYVSARKAIITSMTQLDAVPHVDREGLVLKLSALSQQTVGLPMLAPNMKHLADRNSQQTGWQKTVEQLKNVVLIERNTAGMPIYLKKSQRASLQVQIMQLYSQAQWAVLHRQKQVYHASLKQIQFLLKRYYSVPNPRTQAMLTSLAQLQAATIAPNLPSIKPALVAIENAQQGIGQ
tara:strand:+ start:76722 stop:77720 length:999 start_codon:yes stop_codon:yes gene_type:complete